MLAMLCSRVPKGNAGPTNPERLVEIIVASAAQLRDLAVLVHQSMPGVLEDLVVVRLAWTLQVSVDRALRRLTLT